MAVAKRPDSLLLRNMVNTPVVARGEQVIARKTPEKFMRCLCLQYRGAYVQCGEAVKHQCIHGGRINDSIFASFDEVIALLD